MEYASGGELYDYIDDKKGLEDKEARNFSDRLCLRLIICIRYPNRYLHKCAMDEQSKISYAKSFYQKTNQEKKWKITAYI